MRKALIAFTAALAMTSAATVAMANPSAPDSGKAPVKANAFATTTGPTQLTEAQMDGVTAGTSIYVYRTDRIVTYTPHTIPVPESPLYAGYPNGVCIGCFG